MAPADTPVEGSNISFDPDDHVRSVSLPEPLPALPFEMVEVILVYLSAPDFLFAAVNVLKLWRDVIENSRSVWRILARHRYDNEEEVEKRRPSNKRSISVFNQDRKTIKIFFLQGILFAHRDSFGNAGLIFAPGLDKAPLEILNATTSSLRYQKKGRIGCWFLELFDLEGNLVCKQEVRGEAKAVLGRYFQAIVEDRESMERYLRGGNSHDQLPDLVDSRQPAAKRRKRGSD